MDQLLAHNFLKELERTPISLVDQPPCFAVSGEEAADLKARRVVAAGGTPDGSRWAEAAPARTRRHRRVERGTLLSDLESDYFQSENTPIYSVKNLFPHHYQGLRAKPVERTVARQTNWKLQGGWTGREGIRLWIWSIGGGQDRIQRISEGGRGSGGRRSLQQSLCWGKKKCQI